MAPAARTTPWLGAALAAGALALGGLVGTAAGGGSSPPADAIGRGYQLTPIGRAPLEPASGHRVTQLGATPAASSQDGARRGRIKLSYYIGADLQTIAPGVAQLFEIGCPHKRERPLTGGAFAASPGLVIVNSSRDNPQPGSTTAQRAWYEAVLNITAAPLQWKPFVTCAQSK